jgi:ATP-dependent helicase HrpA
MAMYRSLSTTGGRRSFSGSEPEWLAGAYDQSLPIFKQRREIIQTLRANQVVIIAGETGCGKTTHLPLICLEARGAFAGRIVVAQPRRIAAISCANHLASRFPHDRSALVGYKVRFHENVRLETKILFATDGILLAETVGDRMLSKYETIIIDEAHERSLPIDFLLGYLRTLLLRRPELKLLIASATLDTRLFSRCFRDAPVITVSGRRYPVEIRFEPVISLWQGSALRSYVDGVIHAVRSIVDSGEPGDILAFLPTVDDIQECCIGLRALMQGKASDVFQLYGRMSPEEQNAIFTRSSRRRIICATNIAETSITVPGIRFVVDTGLARCVRFDPSAGITRMPVERISKASADQRSGRCGRVQNGICIRLFSEAEYDSMPRYTPPEIRRSNLAGVILRMAHLGFGKPQQFPFVQQPSPAWLDAGYRQLRFLGALDSRGRLTELGKAMAALPLDPAIARMLLYAQGHGAFAELAVITSALSVGEIRADQANSAQWRTPQNEVRPDKGVKGLASDFIGLLDIWRALPWNDHGGISRRRLAAFCETQGFVCQRVKEWVNVHRQLVRICRRFGRITHDFSASYEQVHKSLISALAGNCAEAGEDGLYSTNRMREIMISPGSRLFKTRHDWVLLHDITETKRPYARYAAVIKTRWIQDLFPAQCRSTYDEPRYDPEWGTVTCLRNVTFNGLHIVKNQRMEYGLVRPEEAHEAFVKEALVGRMAGESYEFIARNRAVTDMIKAIQCKLRTRSLLSYEAALAGFYGERLPGIFNLKQLNARIHLAKGERFLHVRPEDILGGPMPKGLEDFPDMITVAGREVPVSYENEPESDADGATAVISLMLYKAVPIHFWEWLLPVFIRKRIRNIAQQWTGEIPFQEFELGVEKAVKSLAPGQGHFLHQALSTIKNAFHLGDAIVQVPHKPLPPHEWLRLNIVDEKGKTIEAFRPPHLPEILPIVRHGLRPLIWQQWCAQWESENMNEWKDGEAFINRSINPPGQLAPVVGITGLAREKDRVCMRVFFSKGAAYGAHRQGIRLLLENALEETIAWAWRDFLNNHRIPFQLRESLEKMHAENALEQLFHKIVLDSGYDLPSSPDGFVRLKDQAMQRIPHAGAKAIALASAVFPEYETCRRFFDARVKAESPVITRGGQADRLEQQLNAYWNMLFEPDGNFDTLNQLPRYLRGFLLRMRMAMEKPLRYAQCVQMLEEFSDLGQYLRMHDETNLPDIKRLFDEFEAMIEEYALVVFTHGQVAPRFHVSEQGLRKKMEELGKAVSAY